MLLVLVDVHRFARGSNGVTHALRGLFRPEGAVECERWTLQKMTGGACEGRVAMGRQREGWAYLLVEHATHNLSGLGDCGC